MKFFMFEGTPEEISQVVKTMQPSIAAVSVEDPPVATLPVAVGDGSKFVTVEFARRLLTRIPLSEGILSVIRTAYAAYPGWASSEEVYTASGYNKKQFSGLMGAFGRRMANTPGYDEDANFFEYQWDHAAAAWQYRLPDTVREAVEAEGLI